MLGTGVDSWSVQRTLQAVAKYMRINVATKLAVMKKEKVEYFTGELVLTQWGVRTCHYRLGGMCTNCLLLGLFS